MAIDPFANCNPTIPHSEMQYCTLETCCLAQSRFLYLPSYSGNLFLAVLFAIFLLPQLGLGIFYRTWGFMVGMILGLVLECIGYVARVKIHDSPFTQNPFLIYLIALTIAPVFISGAIYLCLTRIIVMYGEHLSRFRPATIVIFFMTSDFLSLLLQAIGGAIAETANKDILKTKGLNLMVAGLVLQAIILVAFLAVCADFAWTARQSDRRNNAPTAMKTRRRGMFKAFLFGLLLATVVILIRSIFRAAELRGGFSGRLWNDETDFMVLDGSMVAIATLTLTALHPGIAFGGNWATANWRLKSRKNTAVLSTEVEPKNQTAAVQPCREVTEE